MKLIVPAFDDPQERDTICIGAMIQDLERKIAELYSVHPVMSNKAYEEFDMGDGSVNRLTHVVFGYVSHGRLSDLEIVEQLFLCVWGDVRRAWEPGEMVMWRRRPEVKEENDKDPGWFEAGKSGPDDNAPDNWRVKVTIRLGSFANPKVRGHSEGVPLPALGMPTADVTGARRLHRLGVDRRLHWHWVERRVRPHVTTTKGTDMKVWVNTEFTGHYPVGTAAVVVAATAEDAARFLNSALAERGLDSSAEAGQFVQLKTSKEAVVILNDGNY